MIGGAEQTCEAERGKKQDAQSQVQEDREG